LAVNINNTIAPIHPQSMRPEALSRPDSVGSPSNQISRLALTPVPSGDTVTISPAALELAKQHAPVQLASAEDGVTMLNDGPEGDEPLLLGAREDLETLGSVTGAEGEG